MFKVRGSGFLILELRGEGVWVQSLWFRVQGSESRVQGSGFVA